MQAGGGETGWIVDIISCQLSIAYDYRSCRLEHWVGGGVDSRFRGNDKGAEMTVESGNGHRGRE